MKAFLLPTLLVTSLTSQAQYLGFDLIDAAEVRTWAEPDVAQYGGVFHFGDSEGESTLYLWKAGGEWIGQIKRGDFNDDGTAFIWEYTNLEDIDVDAKGNFSSANYQGAFVYYEGDAFLQVYESWSGICGPGEYELGYRYPEALDQFFSGDYPQASLRIVTPKELKALSKSELQVMRNEIFARYGYTFRAGGAMEAHFSAQDWYSADHTHVDAFLTTLERRNIALIQAEERSR